MSLFTDHVGNFQFHSIFDENTEAEAELDCEPEADIEPVLEEDEPKTEDETNLNDEDDEEGILDIVPSPQEVIDDPMQTQHVASPP